ncbi:MAG: hypothetical protein V4584_18725 [Verrucomicrobiota bacterium]
MRYLLVLCLLASAGFAAWSWFRPYEWQSDPAARCEILETLVTRDQSFFWVHVHVKVVPGMAHDLQKPVYLEAAAGKKLEPADTTFGGADARSTTDIWFKFWLESSDLQGPLALHLNDGALHVRTGSGVPDLGSSKYRNFTSNQW